MQVEPVRSKILTIERLFFFDRDESVREVDTTWTVSASSGSANF